MNKIKTKKIIKLTSLFFLVSFLGMQAMEALEQDFERLNLDNELNDDLSRIVFSKLDNKSLRSCLRVNKRWNRNASSLFTRLDLRNHNLVNKELLRMRPQRYQNLKTIIIGNNSKAEDIDIVHLAAHCPQLQVIYLGDNSKVTDMGIGYLAAHCPNLQWIDLGWYSQVTDAGIRYLAAHCPNLQGIGK